MGIFCNIHVVEPPNKEFNPGSVVSGHIRYKIDKDTTVKSVNVSFRGCGKLQVEEYQGKRTSIYTNAEEYLRIKNNILNKSSNEVLPVGEYETFFQFQLPEDIPPTLKYKKTYWNHEIRCKISYIVKIKFIVSGTFNFDKKFIKEVTVGSSIKPKLSMVPGVIYGDSKTLFQPLRSNKSIVNVKAYLKNPVVEPGDTLELVYSIINDTNKTVKSVEVKVIEIYTFNIKKYGKYRQLVKSVPVVETDFKTSSLGKGDGVESDSKIVLPAHLHCLEHSKIVSRDYAIVITVHLPIPYVDMVLKIPFQVGKTSLSIFVPDSSCSNNEATDELPTYWEAMNECLDIESKVKGN